ncbi:hypothetical protein D3C77_764230 [compost metagenome]
MEVMLSFFCSRGNTGMSIEFASVMIKGIEASAAKSHFFFSLTIVHLFRVFACIYLELGQMKPLSL